MNESFSYYKVEKHKNICHLQPNACKDVYKRQGFNRIEVNGEMKRIDEYTPVAGDEVYLLVDRMAVATSKDAISRLTDSAETAMYEGDGTCMPVSYTHLSIVLTVKKR